MKSRNHGFTQIDTDRVLICDDSRQGTSSVVPTTAPKMFVILSEAKDLLFSGGVHASI